MRFLDTLALAFINTFGITRPTGEARRRAAWFILGLLLLTLAAVLVVGAVLYRTLHQ